MSRPSEGQRVLSEALRQARVDSGGGTSAQGPSASGDVRVGTVVSGRWVAYGRVGITPLSDGFRVRGT